MIFPFSGSGCFHFIFRGERAAPGSGHAGPPTGERIFEPYRAAVNSSVCSGQAFFESMEVLPRDIEEEGRGLRAIILWDVFIHGYRGFLEFGVIWELPSGTMRNLLLVGGAGGGLDNPKKNIETAAGFFFYFPWGKK